MGGTDDLKCFVALDIETTGTDPRQDEVIELGAVRIRDGQPADRFERLLSPSQPISPLITQLTGITPADCQGQPPLSAVLPFFLQFLGDDAIVAHNADFDLSFLRHALKQNGRGDLKRDVHDTLQLSRIIVPRLNNHQLGTVLHYYAIGTGTRHRAMADAENTAGLFLCLLDDICRFDLDTLQRLLGLSPPASTLQRFFLYGVQHAALSKRGRREENREMLLDFFNVQGEGRRQRPGEPVEINTAGVKAAFGKKGVISRAFPAYEERVQQVDMAGAVSLAFNQSEVLLVEAGTGVGKTLAYLVPAIRWARTNGERVLISTKTKHLQEQLFYNDIPLLMKVLDEPFRAVLMKGRTNYLCLNKWHRLLADVELSWEERLQVLPIAVWATETGSGDIAENTGFPLFQQADVWNRICADGTFCLGQSCRYRSNCFYQRVRSAAQSAHLVITNHALLFSDAQMDHMVLDPYAHLILDEAHTVEKVAAQHFGCQCSVWRVRTMLNRIYQSGAVETGILVYLLRRVGKSGMNTTAREALTRKLKKALERAEQTRQASEDFFSRLASGMSGGEGVSNGRYTSKFRYDSAEQPFDDESSRHLLRSMNRLSEMLSHLVDGLAELSRETFSDQAELIQDLASRAQECQDLGLDLSFLLAADDSGSVYWIECPFYQGRLDPRLFAAPLEVGGLMRDHFYSNLKTTVFTSGTLTVNNTFDYTLERLGLEADRTVTLQVGSPFDYDQQSLVCVPAFLPSPKERTYQEEVSRLIEEVVLTMRRGTLALFTSYEMLLSTRDRLQAPLEKERVLLLCQGLDGSRSTLLNFFKEKKGAVLLGTESFWEGIDVPGQALEILIVTKLPFAVPSEPVVEARMEQYQRKGLDPFRNYSVPEAVMKFRQGFGRLIRSRTDRGVVLICDTRVLTASYGPLFLNSLPTRASISSDREGLLAEMRQWLETTSP